MVIHWTKQRPVTPTEPAFLTPKVNDYFQRRLNALWGGQHPLKGRTPGAGAIKMCTNDYLCLAHNAVIMSAEIAALQEGGHGDSVSRVWLHHTQDVISTFEQRVAKLLGAGGAVLCSSGYTANVGLIQSFARPGAPVYLDQKAHISLWEGVKSAGALPIAFRHNDAGHLRRQLEKHGPGLVAVDALYSTDGDICPLLDIVEAVEHFAAALIVDETHSFGTQGPGGAGLVAEMGLAHRVHFRTFGLSKAVAARGGMIACSERHAEFFRYEALPTIFSTSVLPHEVAGYNAVLDVVAGEPWRRERLAQNHSRLRQGLDALGYNVDASKAQIIALEAGDIVQTTLLRDALETRGVFGAIFFPPATPDNRCLIRFTANCGLSDTDLDRVLAVCDEIRDEVRMKEWRSTRRKRREVLETSVAAPHAA